MKSSRDTIYASGSFRDTLRTERRLQSQRSITGRRHSAHASTLTRGDVSQINQSPLMAHSLIDRNNIVEAGSYEQLALIPEPMSVSLENEAPESARVKFAGRIREIPQAPLVEGQEEGDAVQRKVRG